MHRFRTTRYIVLLMTVLLLLTSCAAQGSQSGTSSSAAAGSASASSDQSAAPASAAAPSEVQQAPEPSPSSEQPKNATWVIDIYDTTEYTDEMGIIWNYTLTFHASKPGGMNPTGEFMGDAELKIEPDIDSVKAAAASEGTTLLSMVFNYHAECESLSFVVEKMNTEPDDSPLAPLTNVDFTAESSAVFNSTQEPVQGTIQTDEGPFSAAGGGGGATVDVPFTIEITGASVSVKFESLPQPLEYAFKGTISGDVLPG